MGALLLDIALTTTSLWMASQTVIRVLQKRTTSGLSVGLMMLTLYGTSTWIVSGIERGQLAQIVCNAASALSWTIVLVAACVFDKTNSRRIIVMTISCIGLTVAVHQYAGLAGLGLLATLWSVIGKVPQSIESWVRPGGIAISLPVFAVGACQSAAWALYGLTHGDTWVFATAAYAMANCAFVFVRTVQGRRAIAEVEEMQPSVELRLAG